MDLYPEPIRGHGAQVEWDVADAAPALFARLLQDAPWVAEELGRYRAAVPTATTCEPFATDAYFRPALHLRCFYRRGPGSGVIPMVLGMAEQLAAVCEHSDVFAFQTKPALQMHPFWPLLAPVLFPTMAQFLWQATALGIQMYAWMQVQAMGFPSTFPALLGRVLQLGYPLELL